MLGARIVVDRAPGDVAVEDATALTYELSMLFNSQERLELYAASETALFAEPRASPKKSEARKKGYMVQIV